MEKEDRQDLRKALLEIRRLMGADIVVTLLVGESHIAIVESAVQNPIDEEDNEVYHKTTLPKTTKLSKIMRYLG